MPGTSLRAVWRKQELLLRVRSRSTGISLETGDAVTEDFSPVLHHNPMNMTPDAGRVRIRERYEKGKLNPITASQIRKLTLKCVLHLVRCYDFLKWRNVFFLFIKCLTSARCRSSAREGRVYDSGPIIIIKIKRRVRTLTTDPQIQSVKLNVFGKLSFVCLRQHNNK